MSKRLGVYEAEALKGVRDEARLFIGDIFPKARVDINLSKVDGNLGVAAHIIGDTAPHSPQDIMESLAELGVSQVVTVNRPAA